MPKLTKNYIDKITAPADKEAFHWDDSLKGFGLRVTPTGKITYIVQGRVNGSSPRISIDPHGVFTVDQARDVAREHLRSMRMGIDPRRCQVRKRRSVSPSGTWPTGTSATAR